MRAKSTGIQSGYSHPVFYWAHAIHTQETAPRQCNQSQIRRDTRLLTVPCSQAHYMLQCGWDKKKGGDRRAGPCLPLGGAIYSWSTYLLLVARVRGLLVARVRRDALQPLEGLGQALAVPAALALAVGAPDEPEAAADVVQLDGGVHGDDGGAYPVARVPL